MGHASGGAELLLELAAKEKRSIPVIFGSMSENGPCLGAVIVSNTDRTDVIGRHINSIEAGFRPGHTPRDRVV